MEHCQASGGEGRGEVARGMGGGYQGGIDGCNQPPNIVIFRYYYHLTANRHGLPSKDRLFKSNIRKVSSVSFTKQNIYFYKIIQEIKQTFMKFS